jgi:hypothetical protein
MATRRSMVLRLLRESTPAPEAPPRGDAEPVEPSPDPRGVFDALHGRVRTFATGFAPKGRRIRPPIEDDAEEANADGRFLSPTDPVVVPVHRVQELLEIYTRFMGPASKRVLDAQLRAFGATPRTLTVGSFPALVKRLAALIDTSEKKRRFLVAMTKVPGAIG